MSNLNDAILSMLDLNFKIKIITINVSRETLIMILIISFNKQYEKNEKIN